MGLVGRLVSRIAASTEKECSILFQHGRYSPNCNEFAHSHADAMQIILFCMAYFLMCDLVR